MPKASLYPGIRLCALGTILLSLGCSFTFQGLDYRSANKDLEQKNYAEAIKGYSRVIRRNPDTTLALDAARTASRVAIFDLKDFNMAVEFYRHIVLYSREAAERLAAQRGLADLYFDKLLDYNRAVVEYSRLIGLVSKKERPEIRFIIAKSYFNLNNLNQALVEVDEILQEKALSEDLQFEVSYFRGNLLQALKRLDEAIVAFQKLIKKYPQRADRENIFLNLAVCFEEKGDFGRAIDTLEQLKPTYATPEFLELRIQSLRNRLAQAPGSKASSR